MSIAFPASWNPWVYHSRGKILTDEKLTTSALAERTGIPSKTLRYWENLDLLPKAARSHTGNQLFEPENIRQVEFVQKARSIGLTLAKVASVLQLALKGEGYAVVFVVLMLRKIKI